MTSSRLMELILRGPVLGDGAMGTMLQSEGMTGGICPELWNVENPEAVRRVHAAYVAAGSQMISTNTFGGSRLKLAAYGLEHRVSDLNSAGVRLAKEIAGSDHLVVASIGPTGKFLEPLGDLTFEEAVRVFAEQASAQAEAGADALLMETFSDLQELKSALAGGIMTGLPCICTMAFDTGGRTMMGIDPVSAAKGLAEAGASVVGANCGIGPGGMIEVIRQMREATDLPVMAQPNAGVPRIVGGNVVFDATPEDLGKFARQCKAIGVNLIGGCCGSTPTHIRAMADALAE